MNRDDFIPTEEVRSSPRFKAAFKEAIKQFLRDRLQRGEYDKSLEKMADAFSTMSAKDSFNLTITINMVAGDLVFMPLLVQAYAEDR